MKRETVSQGVRRIVWAAITIAMLTIATVSYVGLSVDFDESVSNDNSSQHLTGPITDDGGGG